MFKIIQQLINVRLTKKLKRSKLLKSKFVESVWLFWKMLLKQSFVDVQLWLVKNISWWTNKKTVPKQLYLIIKLFFGFNDVFGLSSVYQMQLQQLEQKWQKKQLETS